MFLCFYRPVLGHQVLELCESYTFADGTIIVDPPRNKVLIWHTNVKYSMAGFNVVEGLWIQCKGIVVSLL